jgi:Phage integrase family
LRNARQATLSQPNDVAARGFWQASTDELLAYRQSLGSVAANAPVFPTRTGERRNKDNVRSRVIAPAVRRANELREAAGGSPLPPGVTPHALRHTFISFLLEAGASPRYVMGQVGHTDPKTTLQVYAHILKRDRTGVGRALDDLIHRSVASDTQTTIPHPQGNGRTSSIAAEAIVLGPENGPASTPIDRIPDQLDTRGDTETPGFAGPFWMGAAGFEPATSRV